MAVEVADADGAVVAAKRFGPHGAVARGRGPHRKYGPTPLPGGGIREVAGAAGAHRFPARSRRAPGSAIGWTWRTARPDDTPALRTR
ncbi:hypothetical protein GCM10010361_50130 [Streptomyces olivaceiscleroticus]|uniref:Uncharacterized protein n=1 Tax=Streptomyces olivaceiscleroticus TaxID=68245 RepID=A0ABN1ALZ6_9ACTN